MFAFKMLEEQNVKFHMNDGVTEIKGENGEVTLPLLYQQQTFFTEDIVTCHCRKTTGVANNIKDGSIIFKCDMSQCLLAKKTYCH